MARLNDVRAKKRRAAIARCTQLSWAIATTVAVLTLVAVTPASAASAVASSSANGEGRIRVAHLSPTTAGADIWVTASNGQQTEFAHDVTYGGLTSYASVPSGTYSVSMFPTGSKSGEPLLQGHFTVAPGGVYTVVVTGTPSHLADRVINDQLGAPSSGDSRVRVVQASTTVGSPTIRVQSGEVLANNIPYGTVTNYADVPSGDWKLTLSTVPKVPITIDLIRGAVYTLFVLNSATGATVLTATDATAAPGTFVVRSGDSLWSVASAILTNQTGTTPTGAQIEAYIPELVAANESHFKDPTDPSLIFTGQILVAPPSK